MKGRYVTVPEVGFCPANHYTYIIKAGDTLNKLSASFGVSVTRILTANPGINPNRLMIDQIICIPVCPPNNIPVAIQAGDTISKLAQKYNVSVAGILDANPGVNPNNLMIGQLLCVPQQCDFENTIATMQRIIRELVSQSQFQRDSDAQYGTSTAKTTVVSADDYSIKFDAVPGIFSGINYSAEFIKGQSYPYYITAGSPGQKTFGVKDDFGVWQTFSFWDQTASP